MGLARRFNKAVWIGLILLLPVAGQHNTPRKAETMVGNAKIDSLLNRYYLDGVKLFIAKLGVLSVRQKNLNLQRSDFDDRLMINIQKSLSLNKNDLQVTMQYKLNPHLYLKGYSVSSLRGSKNSVNLVYKLEY